MTFINAGILISVSRQYSCQIDETRKLIHRSPIPYTGCFPLLQPQYSFYYKKT